MPTGHSAPIKRLATYDERTENLNVIIETPAGCRNKYKYDNQRDLFKLNSVLPDGANFPFDFGFIPGTLGEDGDPLDVLVLMDQAAFTGCLLQARLIGVLEAEQTEDEETERNDRLIAVAVESKDHADVTTLKKLNAHLLEEIEHFFVSYAQMHQKKFKPLGYRGPRRAEHLVAQAQRPRRGPRSRRKTG